LTGTMSVSKLLRLKFLVPDRNQSACFFPAHFINMSSLAQLLLTKNTFCHILTLSAVPLRVPTFSPSVIPSRVPKFTQSLPPSCVPSRHFSSSPTHSSVDISLSSLPAMMLESYPFFNSGDPSYETIPMESLELSSIPSAYMEITTISSRNDAKRNLHSNYNIFVGIAMSAMVATIFLATFIAIFAVYWCCMKCLYKCRVYFQNDVIEADVGVDVE
jgi:hypothetical protein